jgi:hypothetical protein
VSDLNNGREYEFEAEHGLPEPLPAGERVLWQGAPDWKALAIQRFHVRKLAVYFAIILGLRFAFAYSDTGSLAKAGLALAWIAPAIVFAMGMWIYMAWLTARTTVYTVTDKRVVMRIGIVLTLTLNLPLKRIARADLKTLPDGLGSIPMQLAGNDKIAWFHLWPHCRPWRLAHPEPMLSHVADARHVAEVLGAAWAAATGLAVTPVAQQAAAPAATGMPAPLPMPSSERPGRAAAGEPALAGS